MFPTLVTLLKRHLAFTAVIAMGASGTGLLVGSQSNKGMDLSLGQPPVETQAVPTSTSIGKTDSTTTSTVPLYNAGFINTLNPDETLAAWKAINDRPRSRIRWTGSTNGCDPGTTSQESKEDVLARVKWFRAMAGVDTNITQKLETSRLAQEAALVMKVNNQLSHEPSSDWDCYTEDAYEGASHSNLYLGVFGVKSIDGYIEDPGSTNYFVGHRRCILNPRLAEIGTGDTNYSNALFVINENTRENFTTREPDGFVMWPPRGYVPRDTIFPRWSISHSEADFTGAQVRIDYQGRTKIINNAYSDTDNYGELHTLVFNWIRPSKGTGSAVVTVSGIELNGTQRSLTYEVRPFD